MAKRLSIFLLLLSQTTFAEPCPFVIASWARYPISRLKEALDSLPTSCSANPDNVLPQLIGALRADILEKEKDTEAKWLEKISVQWHTLASYYLSHCPTDDEILKHQLYNVTASLTILLTDTNPD